MPGDNFPPAGVAVPSRRTDGTLWITCESSGVEVDVTDARNPFDALLELTQQCTCGNSVHRFKPGTRGLLTSVPS